VVYDPELTLDLAPELTAATGINALAHCVEALYSITRNPLATAAARAGIEAIAGALPRCYSAGTDLEARGDLLAGAYLAGTALATVAMGLHHGLCHVLGGTAGVPHGMANAIILPHAMRFNQEASAPQLGLAADALGLATRGQSDLAAAGAATERVAELIGRLGLPRRLRDAGVAMDDLPRLAEIALLSRAVRNNPRPVRDAAEIEALLRAAW
jgi:alcohol dehydrogenase class IV